MSRMNYAVTNEMKPGASERERGREREGGRKGEGQIQREQEREGERGIDKVGRGERSDVYERGEKK